MMGSAYSYRSTWEAIHALVAHGGLSGVMRGYWATNAVWVPWNAIYIASYEGSKRAAARALEVDPASGVPVSGGVHSGAEEATLPAWAVAGCAAASSTLAVTLTHPADVVKTRLQVASTLLMPNAQRCVIPCERHK